MNRTNLQSSSSTSASKSLKARKAISSAARIEALESRTMQSVTPVSALQTPVFRDPILILPKFHFSTAVNGTAGNDVINITTDPANSSFVKVTVNGTTTVDESWGDVGVFGLYVDGLGGTDTVNVGMGNVQGFGDIHVDNSAAFGRFNVNVSDFSDSTARSMVQDLSGNYETITGLNGATIAYNAYETNSANLTTGYGADSVTVKSTMAYTSLNSSGGRDNVYVGYSYNASAPGTRGLFGQLTIQNTPSYDNLYICDTGDNVSRNVSQSLAGAFNYVSGLAPAQIVYKTADMSSVTFFYGGGNNTIGAGYGSQTIYTGNGNNQVYASNTGVDHIYAGVGRNTFVTVGEANCDLHGGGGINSYWVNNSGQSISDPLSFIEGLMGDIHYVGGFQTLNVHHSNGTTTSQTPSLAGDWSNSLIEPDGGGTYTNYANQPLFTSSGPTQNDVNQRSAADCYFLSGLAGIAKNDPNRIQQSVARLGDGTFIVRFFNASNTAVYYRVDGKLLASGGNTVYATLGQGGTLWAPLIEKAFTFFRSNQGTYASINYGGLGEPFADLAGGSSGFWGSNATDVLNSIKSNLDAGKLVTVATIGSPTGHNVVGNHAYTVESVQTQTITILGFINITVPVSITLRNPWGYNGVNSGTSSDGGYGTIAASDFFANFSWAQAGLV